MSHSSDTWGFMIDQLQVARVRGAIHVYVAPHLCSPASNISPYSGLPNLSAFNPHSLNKLAPALEVLTVFDFRYTVSKQLA